MTPETEHWDVRIAEEFRECPGLRLTIGQAARLWHLPAADVERILLRLMDAGVVTRSSTGAFVACSACTSCP